MQRKHLSPLLHLQASSVLWYICSPKDDSISAKAATVMDSSPYVAVTQAHVYCGYMNVGPQ